MLWDVRPKYWVTYLTFSGLDSSRYTWDFHELCSLYGSRCNSHGFLWVLCSHLCVSQLPTRLPNIKSSSCNVNTFPLVHTALRYKCYIQWVRVSQYCFTLSLGQIDLQSNVVTPAAGVQATCSYHIQPHLELWCISITIVRKYHRSNEEKPTC